ncbi:MAG TPA: HD domain-containing protein [Anaerolineales bacterium]|jgi:HD superfamily phosphodiesterase
MQSEVLVEARKFLVERLKDSGNYNESRHPWRRDWQFAVLHSLRIEAYVLKILERQDHHLTPRDVILLRLAAILHDISRLEKREGHAQASAQVAAGWLRTLPGFDLADDEIETVSGMIAAHSDKNFQDGNFSLSILKDADTLDEIGVMSIFMAANWVESHSPFYFYDLRARLVEVEIPFCQQKLALLNTSGARQILEGKMSFIQNFIAQLNDELQAGPQVGTLLNVPASLEGFNL